eukprot:Colp12_sorted_trinity150504_noHs@14236
MRLPLLILAALVAVINASDSYLEHAKRLASSHPIIDGHNDLPWAIRTRLGNKLENIDLNHYIAGLDTDIPRLREGQLGGQFWSVYVNCNVNYTAYHNDLRMTLEQIDLAKRLFQSYPDVFEYVETADQLVAAFKRGKIASLMGIEGGHQMESSLSSLRQLYAVGARYMTLTHSCHTPWADTCSHPPVHNGLTDFGREVVLEMNRLGMLVDISHVSAKTMSDVLDVSKAPVIFSHSSAYTVHAHPRNVPDDILVRMKDNGGVVMVNFYNAFVW